MSNSFQLIARNVFLLDRLDFDWREKLGAYSQLSVIADTETFQYCYTKISSYLPDHQCIVIPAGEHHKHLGTCQLVWQKLTEAAFDRKGLVLNLGGGVVGDLGGFCAATYKRGIDFIQLPTTLLSQVDASVGGKLGIDFQGFKNHIGVFTQPKSVWVYPGFLDTLPELEVRSGFAEVIKHALIADAEAWKALLASDQLPQDWNSIIPHSIAIKDKVVEADPTEKGLRKILNFGHTIGHAVETYFLDKGERRLLHGEAVALGMIAETWLSWQKGMINQLDYQVVADYLFKHYGKVPFATSEIADMSVLALQDKKNVDGKIMCTLLQRLGHASFDHPITLAEIHAALEGYSSYLK